MHERTGAVVVDLPGFAAFLRVVGLGRHVLGPVLADGVISIGEVHSIDDLPRGWTDDQAPGRYRAVPRSDAALFGYAVGARSWRPEVNPARTTLVHIRRTTDDPYDVEEADPADGVEPVAWLGVRGCDLAALAITDRVFLGGAHPDPHYAARRAAPFIVAVDCGAPAATCFCPSMGTGPSTEVADGGGADIRVTELCDDQRHEFVLRPVSDAGHVLLAQVPSRPATEADLAAAADVIDGSVEYIAAEGRHLETADLRDRLGGSLEDPRWDAVADRCLSCGNCTMVCPTCFCSSVEDSTNLAGNEATRTRVWESCFSLDHSYLHGGSVRASTRSRYRQWLTHKLDTWWDQFDTSGCVGCGRCITWCPVGIDITDEAAAIGSQEAAT